MIEYLVGGLVTIGLGAVVYFFREPIGKGINWVLKKFKLDANKFDVQDIIQVYEALQNYISGGDDKVRDLTDLVELASKLEQIIKDNQITK